MRCQILYGLFVPLLLQSMVVWCQVKEEFDNLILFIPQGLTISRTDNSLLLSDESVGGEQFFNIMVNKTTYSLKRIEKSYPELWHDALLNEGMDNPAEEPGFVKAQTNSGWNCFRGGKLVQYNAQTSPFYYHLTVMRYLGITLSIITRASNEDLFIQELPLLMQLVLSVNFKSQPAQQNPYQSGSPNPVQSSQQTIPGNPGTANVNGLYINVQGDLLYHAEMSVLYFSPDGTVFTDIPGQGFFNLNLREQQAKFPSMSGSYTTHNNTLSVKMNNQGIAMTYSVDQDGSISPVDNPGLAFRKIESLDNYRFEGVYINRQTGANTSIAFTHDGQFTDNGLIKTIVSENSEGFPRGNGSYSSSQNSVLFQYADGRQLQLCFYMMPEDYQKGPNPEKILINNFLLIKQ